MTDAPKKASQTPTDSQPTPAATDSATERFQQAAQARQDADDDREEHLWKGGFSPKGMIGQWVLAGVVTVVLLLAVVVVGLANPLAWIAWLVVSGLLWGGLGSLLVYRKLTVKYALTTQRFVHESGLLTRVTNRIEVIDIDDVAFQQGLIERMVGVGSIAITSSDRSHPELVLRGIDRVAEVAGMIDDVRRKERRRRGLHIESV